MRQSSRGACPVIAEGHAGGRRYLWRSVLARALLTMVEVNEMFCLHVYATGRSQGDSEGETRWFVIPVPSFGKRCSAATVGVEHPTPSGPSFDTATAA